LTDTTQAPQPNAAKAEPKRAPVSFALYAGRLAQLVAIITALFTVYTEGATAYRSTEEAIQIKAAAENAALRQKAEAELAEQKARVQLEDARNSAERLKGEADKAEAEAKKAEFDAQTAAQAAQNAKLKTEAEAKSLSYEVEIRRSKAFIRTRHHVENLEHKEIAHRVAIRKEQLTHRLEVPALN
jgi:hypothetical protein